MEEEFTREEYIYDIFDRMKFDKKYRPVVKKRAAKGDEECIEAMALWDAYVKEMRRLHAAR